MHISILYLLKDGDFQFLEDLQKHYFQCYKGEIVSQPLLSGSEIMKILNLKPSKEVGELKEKLMLAQLSGEVKTREDAIKYIKNITLS